MVRRRYLAVGGALAIAAVVAVVAVVALSGGGRSETSVADADGTSEGITVHGHWVIEVRQPDGALVSRQEFDNSMLSDGRKHLAGLLAGSRSTGMWQVRVLAAAPADLCLTGRECTIVEPTSVNASDPGFFPNLVVSLVGVGDQLQLSGNFTAQYDNAIGRVSTAASVCGDTVAPASCDDSLLTEFTQRVLLPSPVDVLAGQQVLVKVTLSFS